MGGETRCRPSHCALIRTAPSRLPPIIEDHTALYLAVHDMETNMQAIDQAGTFTLGDRTVKRLGYGAMQLAGPGVFGPPKARGAAPALLRAALARGGKQL